MKSLRLSALVFCLALLLPALVYSSSVEQKYERLAQIFRQQQTEIASLLNDYERQKITLSELENELKKREELLADLQGEIVTLQMQLNETDNDIESLRIQLAQALQESEELKTSLTKALESLRNYRNTQLRTNIVIGVSSGVGGFVLGLILYPIFINK